MQGKKNTNVNFRNQNETGWTIISSMEAHEKFRRKTEMWKSDDTIVDFIKNNTNITQVTEDEIHSVCGYIQVKNFITYPKN